MMMMMMTMLSSMDHIVSEINAMLCYVMYTHDTYRDCREYQARLSCPVFLSLVALDHTVSTHPQTAASLPDLPTSHQLCRLPHIEAITRR